MKKAGVEVYMEEDHGIKVGKHNPNLVNINAIDHDINYEGLLDAINKPGKKKKGEMDAPAPKNVEEKEKVALKMSGFGANFPDIDADWKEYKGFGWVHKSELEMLLEHYAPCEISGKWFKKRNMYHTARGGLVDPENAKNAKWVTCEASSRIMPVSDSIKALNSSDKMCVVSKAWIERNGGLETCSYSGKKYICGSVKKVKSEKYPLVSAHALKNSGKFVSCVKCNNWFEKGDATPREKFGGHVYCDTCYAKELRREVILKHDARDYPAPIYSEKMFMGYKTGKDGLIYSTGKRQARKDIRLFGVEVETEMSIESCQKHDMNRVDMALAIREALGHDFVMTKEDGTLLMNGKYNDGTPNGTNYAGFEIVSAPASLDLHRERWYKILNAKGYKSLRSWDTNTCGFHVHISREVLTLLQIGRIMVFINHPKNQKFVQKVAGRPSCEYYKYKEARSTDVLIEQTKCNETRRWAINLTNPETVEFRIFRGTVNPRHIIRNIEFCDALCDYCYPASSSLQDLGNYEKFIEFVSQNRKFYPMLAEWFAFHKMIKVRPPGKNAKLDKLTLNLNSVAEPEIKSEEKMKTIPQN